MAAERSLLILLDYIIMWATSVLTGTFGLTFANSISEKALVSCSPILIGHICAGTLGLLSGTAAMSFWKGWPRHVMAGKIFGPSMLTMTVGAVYLAIGGITRTISVEGFQLLSDREQHG